MVGKFADSDFGIHESNNFYGSFFMMLCFSVTNWLDSLLIEFKE